VTVAYDGVGRAGGGGGVIILCFSGSAFDVAVAGYVTCAAGVPFGVAVGDDDYDAGQGSMR